MTEGIRRGSNDGYFKLYTHQTAKLIQLEGTLHLFRTEAENHCPQAAAE